MSTYSIKNYYTTHFQYLSLDKIHGQPSLESILHLFKQVKINAQSVPTTLGGGQLGYLALLLSNEAYNTIPNSTPFQRPTFPGPFLVQTPAIRTSTRSTGPVEIPTATAAVVTQQKADWDE